MAGVILPILLVIVSVCDGAKLNTPRILLPFNFQNNPVVYTLEVTDTNSECFAWSSLQEDVVLVEPVEEGGCSNKATVTAISRLPSTQKVIVLAEDVENGILLRCDVIVDIPHSLKIATTTREIYVEEAAEEFELTAYDDQGNQFTTLDGVAFHWSVKGTGVQPVIRIQSFAESSYDTTPAIEALEARGLRGDKVLLVGTATGVVVVTARVQHAHFGELVTEPAVRLSSVANLLLLPPDVYVLPGARLRYTAAQVKHGRLHNIHLDSSPYYLDVNDKNVARLEKAEHTVLALAKGSTEVNLRDSNTEASETGASARFHVVEPASITVTSPSHMYWVAVTGQRVRLQCHLWDVHGNKIWMGENAVVRLSVEPEFFRTDLASDNGTYAEGTTVRSGHAKVRAQLSGYRLPDGSELRLTFPLVATATLEIHRPLAVVPELLVLPWNPATAPTYQIQLNYTGGDGNVAWSSNNSQLASVSQQGVLRTRGRGHTAVTVSLVRNPRIQARAEVYVVPVGGLSLLPGSREAEVGSPLLLPVALHARLPDGRSVNFSRCHQVAFQVELSNERFKTLTKGSPGEPPAGACHQVSLEGTEPGHARTTVRLAEPWPPAEASALVGAYQPLTVVAAADGLLLAPGSCWGLQVLGGPLPWPTRPSGHYSTAESSAPVAVEPMSAADGFWSRVQCQTLGEATLRLVVGNAPSAELPAPAVSRAQLPVHCAVPRRLLLAAQVSPLPGRERLELPACPQHAPLRAHAGQPLPLRLTCEDAAGHRFHNASSLQLAWSEDSGGTLAELAPAAGEKPSPPATDWRTLVPAGREGLLTVRVVMTAPADAARLETKLPLRLVSPLQASPSHLVVFNHPASWESVRLLAGSGHVAVRVPTPAQSALAVCTFHAENGSVTVAPLADGQLTLEVWDLCLAATPPATVSVQISGVTGVELSVVSRLAVGARTLARVAVLGAAGRRLPARLLPLLNVRLEAASNVLGVRYDSAGPDDLHLFEVRGEMVGDATLTARAGAAAAAERRVEVFPPLVLAPRNRTVAVGSSYQLAAAGGPRADADVEFESSQPAVADVSAAGLVTARRSGAVRLAGRVADWDLGTGRHTVYSEDSVEAHVVQLCGVRLRAPLTRIQHGQRQPLYADGVDQAGAVFVIKSPVPGVRFLWNSSYPQTATVTSPLSELCVDSDEGVAMRMTAREPGKAQLSVQLEYTDGVRPSSCPASSPSRATLHVTVYDELRLLSPHAAAASLLMTPRSWLELRPSLLAEASSPAGLVTVGRSGQQLRAGPRTGRDLVWLTSSHEPGANQTLLLLLEVLPAHYLMVTPVADVCVRRGRRALPTGLTVRLNVTAHDTRGRPFHSWLGAAAPVASRADLLQATAVSPAQLVAELRRPGAASLAVAAKADPALGDVLFVDVDDLLPVEQTELTVGDVTCLPSPVTSRDGSPGRWRAEDAATAEVTPAGAVVARRPGVTALTLTLPDGQQARSQLTVLPASQVTLSPPAVSSVSACHREPYWLPLSLSARPTAAARCAEAPSALAAPVPASCLLSFSRPAAGVTPDQLFTAQVVFSARTGGYVCELTPRCPAGPAAARLAVDLVVTAEVAASAGQAPLRSAPLRLSLVPPAHLETAELRLGGTVFSGDLLLVGAPDVLHSVTAVASDGQLLQVSTPRRDGGRLRVPVSLLPAAWSPAAAAADLSVQLSVPASGQTLTVPVRLAAADFPWQAMPPPGWGHVLWLLVGRYWSGACATLTALGVAALVYLGLRQLRPGVAPPAADVRTPPPQFSTPPPPYSKLGDGSPSRTPLWTDDTGPVYGSPSLLRRSPYLDGDRSRSPSREADLSVSYR